MGYLLSGCRIPALCQVRLFSLENVAKLLDVLFDLDGGALTHFEHERRRATQVERHERLQQVFAVECTVAPGRRELVDYVHPELIGDVEGIMRLSRRALECRKRLRRKESLVDLSQVGDALAVGLDHALDVYADRLDPHFEREPE